MYKDTVLFVHQPLGNSLKNWVCNCMITSWKSMKYNKKSVMNNELMMFVSHACLEHHNGKLLHLTQSKWDAACGHNFTVSLADFLAGVLQVEEVDVNITNIRHV